MKDYARLNHFVLLREVEEGSFQRWKLSSLLNSNKSRTMVKEGSSSDPIKIDHEEGNKIFYDPVGDTKEAIEKKIESFSKKKH